MNEILKQLNIQPGALLVNAIGFVILFGVLRKYAFGPLTEIIRVRGEQIASEVQAAEESNRQAQAGLAEAQAERGEIISAAHKDAEQARRAAQEEGQRLLSQARDQARERELQSERNVEAQKAQALAELQRDVSGLAVEMSKRVFAEALDAERHAALLDRFVQDVELLAAKEAKA
jgi:F-type H+-transporting ATPase subunit b